MTEPAIYRRTPEDHAAVRRRVFPLAIAGVICGGIAIVLTILTHVTPSVPPNLLAMNLSFCAMMMGVGVLFYARGTSGTQLAAILCAAAILMGMGGTLLYAWQAVSSRQQREQLEIHNVEAIALAARQYAAQHQGAYPADLLVLLQEKLITPAELHSPYGSPAPPDEAAGGLQQVVDHADYEYLGFDLKSVPPELEKDLLVVGSKYAILRESAAVAFADGDGKLVTLDDLDALKAKTNEVRHKMGLPELKLPEIMEKALEEKAASTATAPAGK